MQLVSYLREPNVRDKLAVRRPGAGPRTKQQASRRALHRDVAVPIAVIVQYQVVVSSNDLTKRPAPDDTVDGAHLQRHPIAIKKENLLPSIPKKISHLSSGPNSMARAEIYSSKRGAGRRYP